MNQVCRYKNECWVRPHGRTLSREEWNSLNVFEKYNLIMSVPMIDEDRRQYVKDGTYADDKMTHRQRLQYMDESPPHTFPPLAPKSNPLSSADHCKHGCNISTRGNHYVGHRPDGARLYVDCPAQSPPSLQAPKLDLSSNANKLENLIASKSLEVDYDKLIELAEAQAVVAKTSEAENARYKAKAKVMVGRLGERDTAELQNAERRATWWRGVNVGIAIVAVANFIVGVLATDQPGHALGITATVIVASVVSSLGFLRAHAVIKRGLQCLPSVNTRSCTSRRLNDWANEGWEVVTSVVDTDGALLYTLKRETPGGATKV